MWGIQVFFIKLFFIQIIGIYIKYYFGYIICFSCIYAFPYDVLIAFAILSEKTPLEKIEDIEILRLLELGYEVRMIEVSSTSIAVGTHQDLEKVRSMIHD